MYFRLLFLPLLLAQFLSHGQQLFVQHYPFDVYKGATQNWEVTQDDRGILYFANNDGVLTFDGNEWNLLPLPNKDFVFSIALNSAGDIYVASYNELGYFRKDADGNYVYHSLVQQLPEPYRNFKYLSQITIHNDIVFFVDYEAVYVYDGNNIEVLAEARVSTITHRDQLFFARKDGLYQYQDAQLQPVDFSSELDGIEIKWASGESEDGILILDDKNRLWKIDVNGPATKRVTLISDGLDVLLRDRPKFRMTPLDNGNLAILSSEELLIVDKHGQQLYSVTKSMVGEDFTYRLMYEDRQHNLWITTGAAIVQVTTSSPMSYYDKHNGLAGVILSLGQLNAHVYAGTTRGIFYRENKTSFGLIDGTAGETWNFSEVDGTLYAAHGKGVFQLDGKRALKIIEHNFVHALCGLKKQPDRMIMGTYNSGIWVLAKNGKTWTKTRIKGFDEETRFILEDNDGSIWISHYNKGIYRLTLNASMDSVVSQSFYDHTHGLPADLNNRVYRLKNGEIVTTTAAGIYQFDKTRNLFVPLMELNDALGQNVCVYNLTENNRGDIYFWAGVPQQKQFAGVLRKKDSNGYQAMLTPFNKTAIPIRDLPVDIDAPLMVIGEEEVWIGNNLRLTNFHPKQKTFYDEPFQAYIKEAWAHDQKIAPTDVIAYDRNSIRIKFSSLFFEKPDRTLYQYTLEGFDKEWSPWTPSAEANFTNLPHGDYNFTVRAQNIYGNISQPARLTFSIAAPWYYTWWAAILFTIIATGSIMMIVRFNTHRIRRQKLQLEKEVSKKTRTLRKKNKEILVQKREIIKQAEELETLNFTKDKLFSIVSHDLRAPIKQIHVIMNLMERKHLSEEEFKAFIPRFKESVEHTVNLIDNLLHWANSQMEGLQVKPTLFDVKQVVDENYQIFKPLAEAKNISLHNQIDSDAIAYADKDMIKLVLRNLVNNAIKFTPSGGEVTLGARESGGHIEVFIKDNGVGLSDDEIASILDKKVFSKSGTLGEKGVGLGLMLCQEFIVKNGGTVSIESEPDKGSKFTFSIPRAIVTAASGVTNS